MSTNPASIEEPFIQYAMDNVATVAHTDSSGAITYVNDKFCEISGYSRDELIGVNHRILRSGVHNKIFFQTMYREIANGRTWHGEICNRRKNGVTYWVDTTIVPHLSTQGKVNGYTAIHFDITERKQLEDALRSSKARLAQLTGFDELTGLPNQSRFRNQLGMLIAEQKKTGTSLHLGMLDVDAFKEINELFGYNTGDLLLKIIGQRIRISSNEQVFISRIGIDEFALLLTDVTDSEARAFFEHILEAVRQPVCIGGSTRRCSASIGIAVWPQQVHDGESLIIAAGLALSHAKTAGRDRIEEFEPKMRVTAERKAAVLEEIEHGLIANEFTLHYQPIVSTTLPETFSLEALLRWQHPQLGLLTPSYFSEGLEDLGVRTALGIFVVQQVFKDLLQLHERDIRPVKIGINLTNSDFRSSAFIDRFFELCEETGIPPTQFCMEVTEGIFLGHHQKRVESGLRRLHAGGVEVALDDFGTGYASLTHLRKLPTDRLKIDMSFVANMASCAEDRAIVRGIIDIAHSLKKAVTAEGVETREQVDLLREMNCDLLQGWYFAKASPVDELAGVLASMPKV